MTVIYLFLSIYNKLINIFVSVPNLPNTVLCTKRKRDYVSSILMNITLLLEEKLKYTLQLKDW